MRIAIYATLAAAATLLAAALAGQGALHTQEEAATVRIDAPSRVDPDSDGFDVTVNVENATDLGGFEIRLTFNPEVIAPDAEGELGPATKGEFLGSSGREVICPDPEVQGSLVLIRCVSLAMEPAAPNGDGTLATFHFVPVAKGESELTFTQARLISPDGKTDYEVTPIDDSIRVAKADSGTLRFIIGAAALVAVIAVGVAFLRVKGRRT